MTPPTALVSNTAKFGAPPVIGSRANRRELPPLLHGSLSGLFATTSKVLFACCGLTLIRSPPVPRFMNQPRLVAQSMVLVVVPLSVVSATAARGLAVCCTSVVLPAKPVVSAGLSQMP